MHLLFITRKGGKMQQIKLNDLEILKSQTEFMINNREILEKKEIERYLRNLEKTRYNLFEQVNLNNKNVIDENEKIDYINNEYKATMKDGILRIYIPETLPKYKFINNYAYKNIMINTAEAVKEYNGLFKTNLTFVLIIVHENQVNMDIDNKFVKPIIDALVLEDIIQDDNINNMFYMALGKSDTQKPYTEAFVMDGSYMISWIENVQKMF